jgi:hypothetical protein
VQASVNDTAARQDKWKITAIIALSLCGLLFIASISAPRLLRSRMAANKAAMYGRLNETFSGSKGSRAEAHANGRDPAPCG